MLIRNWIELGALLLILLTGIIAKCRTAAMVRELDGVGAVMKKKDIAGCAEKSIVLQRENEGHSHE